MKLFLDDIRDPPDNTWTVVRTSDDFVRIVLKHGVPDMISFDHDLGLNITDCKPAPTGMDCAKWLVENELPIKEFKVHSANPVGKANIEGLLNQWKQIEGMK